MPINYRIDYRYQFRDDVCAYCGRLYESEEHPKAWKYGGWYTIPCCMDCNSSKGSKGLKTWLRWVRDNREKKWRKMLRNHYGRRNWLSQLVHEVRDEAG